MLRLVSTLIDYEVEASDGSIGIVRDILFDDITWKLRWLAVDTGDWLTRRHVLFHPSSINLFDTGGKFLQVRLARNLINAAPSLKKGQPVTLDFEARMFAYYDIDQNWQSSIFGERQTQGGLERGPLFNPASPVTTPDGNGCDPHLCSFKTVNGYHNEAKDGPIGHLHDAVIDTTDWLIHYLVVAMGTWGSSSRVLISPHAVQHIDPATETVQLDLVQQQVLSSPPWESNILTDDSYLASIHEHYGWPPYQFGRG